MEPIAIIGAGCRFPGGASTPSKLWDLLAAPRDLTGRPPKNRFNGDAFFHADGTHHGATNAINSYYLEEDVSHFDTVFFNIQPAEAESMDPQQRLLLEVVYDSLCAAGQRVEVLRGSDTAVYVGLMCDDYNTMLRRDWETMPRYTSTGLCRAIHSNRISYFFGWHGASATIDTACSGSMVALDQAIQTLRNGRSKMAVAAGANLLLTPDMSISESKLGMLSTDGHCKMWDASGNGYARGEGVACVVIKTLSQALKDNDTIECIIRETAVNQDGRTPGLTMPSGAAQAELIRSCYERAGLDPLRWPQDRPQFFHAHGTGTQAGDPQESSAIAKALFTEDYEGEKLAVGSIKTIIGHTEGTAGIASVISTMLALKNGVIPQNLHFHNLNPSVVPYYRNLEVPTSARPWKIRAGEVRRASVNSFGFGGTNAHAIMEEYIPIASSTELGTSAGLNLQFTPLVFSASTDKSLKEMLSKQLDFMKSHPNTNLGDVAYTLQHRRSVLSNRKSIMASTAEAAIEALETIVASGPGNDNSKAAIADYQDIQGSRFAGSWPKILGIFTGQGAQWARMGAALIEASPFAQSRLSELDGYLQSVPNPEDRPTWTLREQLLAPKNVSRISEAALSQPLCTAVQVILVDVLKAAGISFAAVIGHSSGEIGTAYAAGLVTASEAIRIAYFRGLYAKLSGNPTRVDSDSASPQSRGAMMAVGASYEEARDFCSREIFTDRIIQIAAVNSDSSITLSGDERAIDEAESLLKAEGKFARKLKVDTAYHSAFMTPCAGPYLSSLDECGVGAGAEDQEGVNTQTRWFSSVLEGEEMTSDKLTNQYWLDNMCNPVLFAGALSEAIKQIGQFDLAIEVGPHPALKGPALATITVSSPNIPYTGLLSRDQDDVTQLGDALGFIWARLGADSVNFSAVESLLQTGSVAGIHKNKVVSDLPSYPFDHGRSYWISNRLPNQYQRRTPPNPILGVACFEAATSGEKQWRNILDPREIPWLKGHKLQGQPVFPAAGYVCMAIEAMNILASEAAAATHGQANEVSLIQLTDVELPHAIAFDDDDDKSQGVEVIFSLSSIVITDSDITAKWACYTATSGSDGKSVLNAKGAASCRLSPVSPCELPSRESETDKESRDNLVDVAVDKFYNFLSRKGYGYSAPFAGVSSIKHRLEYSSGKLLDQSESTWENQLVIHPGLLDSALQTLFAAWVSPGDSRLWALHIPLSFSAITINPYFFTAAEKRTEMSYETYLTSETPTQVAGDIYLFHRDGELGSNNTAVRFEGAVLAPFSPATPSNDVPMFSHYRYGVMEPDGTLAAAGETLSTYEVQMFQDVDRISYWYARNAATTFPPAERTGLLPHFQKYLSWCDRMVDMVTNNQHPKITSACNGDTRQVIDELLARYADRDDIRFVQAVGENLESVFREGTSMLEYMNKDGLLRAFYAENSICSGPTCRWLSNLVAQIAHRFPGMDILEIGAGTGATTSLVLRALGGAYASYTFTDISSGFFLSAEELFAEEASSMIFKTFDMEKPPAKQDYVEGSYDIAVAVNVLHVSGDLEASLSNVRRLLKPGGYLVVGELTSNDLLFTGATVGTLPGWWVGSETGRPWGPLLSLSQWDAVLRKAGFCGIDTVTPDISSSLPMSAFVAQAADDRVSLLRNPLGGTIHPRGVRTDTLAIIGGTAWPQYKLGRQVLDILATRFIEKEHFDTVERFVSSDMVSNCRPDLPPTVLCFTDLDRPFLQDLTAAKFDALKALLTMAATLVWVTCGSRADSPWSYMMTGLINTAKMELPSLHVQVLDLDSSTPGGIRSDTADCLAKAVLRQVALGSWPRTDKNVFGHQGAQKTATEENLLWTAEPQVFISEGRSLIPRLVPDAEKNTRYNSRHRDVFATVDASSDGLQLVGHGADKSLALRVASPLTRLLSPRIESKETVGALQARNLSVEYSLLQSVAVHGAGHLRLCAGVSTDNEDLALALTTSCEKSIIVPSGWCTTKSKAGEDAQAAWDKVPEMLVQVAAELMAEHILSITPAGRTLLVHDADPAVYPALRNHATAKGVRLVLTSTTDQSHQSTEDVVFVRQDLPKYMYRSVIPSSTTVYFQFSRGEASEYVGSAIRSLVPSSCIKLTEDVVLGSKVESPGQAGSNSHKTVAQALKRAVTAALATLGRNLSPKEPSERIPLSNAPRQKVIGRPLAVVDWTTDKSVVAKVQAIDTGIQFANDKSYLFLGMAGELGHSLAWWMMERGARHVILTSRKPKVNAAFVKKAADMFGATITVFSLDITSRESLQSARARLVQDFPPLGGLVNGALILDDSLLVNTTFEQFERVTAPKVRGTQLLDEIFGRGNPSLDFFVVCSSISSVIGWSGQSNYAAANEFMTSLVAQRRGRGLAGSAINIPAVLGVGYAAHSTAFDFEAFEALGFFNISETDLHQLFAEAILSGHPKYNKMTTTATSGTDHVAHHQVAMGVDFITHDFQVANSSKRDIKLSHFVRSKGIGGGGGLSGGSGNRATAVRVRSQLEAAVSTASTRETLHEIIEDGLLAHIRRILRVTEEERPMSGDSVLVEQGVDSLVAVDIRSWFIRELEVDVPTLKVLGGGSIASLVDDALDKFVKAYKAALAEEVELADVPAGGDITGLAPAETTSTSTSASAPALTQTDESSSDDARSTSSQSAQTPISNPVYESELPSDNELTALSGFKTDVTKEISRISKDSRDVVMAR